MGAKFRPPKAQIMRREAERGAKIPFLQLMSLLGLHEGKARIKEHLFSLKKMSLVT